LAHRILRAGHTLFGLLYSRQASEGSFAITDVDDWCARVQPSLKSKPTQRRAEFTGMTAARDGRAAELEASPSWHSLLGARAC